MELIEYINDFFQENRDESIRNGETPKETFMNTIVNRLDDYGTINDPTFLRFYKAGTRGRIMAFDVYGFESSDNSMTLLVTDYIDTNEQVVLTQTEINLLFDRMLNFVEETFNGTAQQFMDPSDDAYKFSNQLKERLNIDFLKLDNDESIDKFKLIIITNKVVSKRVKGLAESKFLGRLVEKNIWDIERIYELEKSGQSHESIFIDITKHNNGQGLPYLRAEFDNVADYDAYLAIIPGKLLSDIYLEHGANLLEGNVRSFLGTNVKYNKGIQQTIANEPDRFFVYNNGIACTASDVIFSDDGKEISGIQDLQIINGGQTTASLSVASKKGERVLDNIFVPMKLTIIKTEDKGSLVANIAKYANSQNKVTDADFFSSHPFHVEMEKNSRKLHAPGSLYETIWYYERVRGQYRQDLFRLKDKREQQSFAKKHPKNQVIVKETLARNYYAAEMKRPDIVSKGRQHVTKQFASLINKDWEKKRADYNEFFYKKIVVYSIIFNKVDNIVKNAPWYETGGYKLNIVPYTISKIMDTIPNDKMIDFNLIWKEQDLYPSFIRQIEEIAPKINTFIRNSGGMIVTEYAKREATWEKLKQIPMPLTLAFQKDLMSVDYMKSEQKQAMKEKKVEQEINIEKEIYELTFSEGGEYWNRLRNEGLRRKMISKEEDDIITRYLLPLAKGAPKAPNQVQMKKIWEFRRRMEDQGVIV